ncbi:serine/threonine-protein kinase [Streptomyces sp. NA04227]|uniref:serine/threonine-protein kinase n=1 Tax=Streptomyces sp. NA04227 TaxID=2742136 RepID=UPI0020CA7775|nr:serine/threonine-protein kinase [Streptomyces sp. NA04227]
MRNSAGADAGPEAGRLVAGRYRLLERIGAGGMGTVWRAGDELLGRDVALKKLHVPPHLSDGERERLYERTRREARSAARIAHPNVIVVHDVVDDGGLPCIVMEYVPSRTLGDVLKENGTLSPQEAARIGHRTAEALRAAHAAGVLHRDVKPGNVLLGDGGRVVLTDFGIAVSSGAPTLTRTGEIVGSLNYLSPERVKGETPGPASDLWALGAMLFEAVEGQPPFRRNTVLEAVYAIASDPVPAPYAAGPLTPLIEQLLAKEPQSRPSAETVEAGLRACAAGDGAGFAADASGGAHRSVPQRDGGYWNGAEDDSSRRGSTLPDLGGQGGAGSGPAVGRGAAAGRKSGTVGGRTQRSRRMRVALAAVAVVVVLAGAAGAAVLVMRDDGTEGQAAKDPAPGNSSPAPASSPPSTSKKPDGSASPTTAEPTGPVEEPPPVPAGYQLVSEEGAGLSLPVPDGWTRKVLEDGSTGFIDPGGLVRLQIGALDFASSDPLQHWKDDERKSIAEGKLPGYKQLRMQGTTFRELPAAIWEFTFEGRARGFRAVDLGFGKPGGTEYTVYLSAPALQWDEYKPVFDNVLAGLRLHEEPGA